MSEERLEVMRGHLQECFNHFSTHFALQVPKQSREIGMLKMRIATFCGVTTQSISRWLNEKILPEGETRIKLMCYLNMVGYRIIELDRLSPPVSLGNFVELIGFDLLSSRDAVTLLGYSTTSSLYDVINVMPGQVKR